MFVHHLIAGKKYVWITERQNLWSFVMFLILILKG